MDLADIGFVFYHLGVAVNDFRYLVTGATVDRVVSGTTEEQIVSAAAEQRIVAVAAVQFIVAVAAMDLVIGGGGGAEQGDGGQGGAVGFGGGYGLFQSGMQIDDVIGCLPHVGMGCVGDGHGDGPLSFAFGDNGDDVRAFAALADADDEGVAEHHNNGRISWPSGNIGTGARRKCPATPGKFTLTHTQASFTQRGSYDLDRDRA